MTLVPLYRKRHGHEEEIFFVGTEACAGCDRIVEHTGFYISNWHPRNVWHKLFCIRCAKDAKDGLWRSQEIRHVRIVDEVPRGAVPMLIQYHGMSSRSDLNTFDVARKSIDGEHVIDRTKLSGREGGILLADMRVGKNPKQIESERQFNDHADVDEIFSFHISAAPALPEGEDHLRLESDDK